MNILVSEDLTIDLSVKPMLCWTTDKAFNVLHSANLSIYLVFIVIAVLMKKGAGSLLVPGISTSDHSFLLLSSAVETAF